MNVVKTLVKFGKATVERLSMYVSFFFATPSFNVSVFFEPTNCSKTVSICSLVMFLSAILLAAGVKSFILLSPQHRKCGPLGAPGVQMISKVSAL